MAPADRYFVGGVDVDRLSASPPLFDNPLLDKLSRVHWSTPLFLYAPVVVALAVCSLEALRPSVVAAATALGYVIWTLFEYFAHRFVFHYEFPGRIGSRIHYLIHGVHHEHPNDPKRLVMPALLSVPIMLSAYCDVRLAFGLPLGYPVLTGLIIGYLIYIICTMPNRGRAST